MEQKLKSGATPRTWYREHAHPVLLPLDEEESHLLRALIGSAKQFHHYLILIHHALDGQEAAELSTIASSLNGMYWNNQLVTLIANMTKIVPQFGTNNNN